MNGWMDVYVVLQDLSLKAGVYQNLHGKESDL